MIVSITNGIHRFSEQYFFGESVGTYLIELSQSLLMFDVPTFSLEALLDVRSFAKPVDILLSHGSCGIADTNLWRRELDAKVYLHEADRNHSWLRITPDVLFKDSSALFEENIEVIHTPGHSSGSVCLLESKTGSLFTGDTLGGDQNGMIRDFLTKGAGDESKDIRLSSCKALSGLMFDKILPFHYEMILNGARGALTTFIEKNEQRNK